MSGTSIGYVGDKTVWPCGKFSFCCSDYVHVIQPNVYDDLRRRHYCLLNETIIRVTGRAIYIPYLCVCIADC